MRVYIAEKPSLGRAIAKGLGGGKADDGCIRTPNGIVTWCFGHILEQYEPQDYDNRYARWQITDLPIVPSPWKNKVRKDAKKQFTVIKKLVETADEIVNCGDPDREGQLLIDEVLEELQHRGIKISPGELRPGLIKKGHPLPGDLYQIQLYSAPALMAVQRLSDVCLTHCTVTLRTALLLVLPLLSDTA